MRFINKLISFAVIIVVILNAFIGCSETKKSELPFADIKWTRSTESDTEYIMFSSDGEFIYYCACGNPVNDSDLCSGYLYNKQNETIKLNYSDTSVEFTTEIKIVKYTDDELVLDFDGDIRKFVPEKQVGFSDCITYNGDEYIYVEFPSDVFVYDLHSYYEAEEDEVIEIPHNKWRIIYCNGDIFALSTDLAEMTSYYSDVNNYTWSVVIEATTDDLITEKELSLSPDEIAFFGTVEDQARNESILFDDIEIFGTLVKTSYDGLIDARTNLLCHNGRWYWRTEAVNEKVEGWPEYIVKLPESLNAKLN